MSVQIVRPVLSLKISLTCKLVSKQSLFFWNSIILNTVELLHNYSELSKWFLEFLNLCRKVSIFRWCKIGPIRWRFTAESSVNVWQKAVFCSSLFLCVMTVTVRRHHSGRIRQTAKKIWRQQLAKDITFQPTLESKLYCSDTTTTTVTTATTTAAATAVHCTVGGC